MLERLAPRKSMQLQVLEMAGILAQAGGAVLAVMGYAEWVAVSAAVALVFQSLVDYFYLSPQARPNARGARAFQTPRHSSLRRWWR